MTKLSLKNLSLIYNYLVWRAHLQKYPDLLLTASLSCWKLWPSNIFKTNIQATVLIVQVLLDISETYSFWVWLPLLDSQQYIKSKIAPTLSSSLPPHKNNVWNPHRRGVNCLSVLGKLFLLVSNSKYSPAVAPDMECSQDMGRFLQWTTMWGSGFFWSKTWLKKEPTPPTLCSNTKFVG